MRTETFIKKSEDENDKIMIRQLIQEEEFELSLNEIERMERGANKQIEMSNEVITNMRNKLKECEKLRKLL